MIRDHKHWKNFGEGCANKISWRSHTLGIWLALSHFSWENVSDFAYQYLIKSGHKIIHLEEFKLVSHKLAKLNTQRIGCIPPKTNIHTKNRLKKAFMSIGGSAGWLTIFFENKINFWSRFSFNPEVSGNETLFGSNDVIILSNLEHLTSIFSGYFEETVLGRS